MEKTIEKIEEAILYGVIFLIPLVVTGSFANVYVTPKLLILTGGVALIVLFKIVRCFINGKIRFSVGNYDFPVLLLISGYVASTIFNTSNKMEALFLPGTTTIMVMGCLLYIIINQSEKRVRKGLLLTIYMAGIAISLITLLASAGIIKSMAFLPNYMKVAGFSPLGGNWTGMIIMTSLLPLGIDYVIKEREMALKAFWGVSLALILFGGMISIFGILPGKPTELKLPSFSTSWVVAVDSLKIKPLLGMGPGNYITAFNRFRPIEYNQTELWKMRFTSARSFYLTVITETGLVGMAGVILIIYSAGKLIKGRIKEKEAAAWPLVILAGWMIMFPSNIVLITFLFVLLALNSEVSKLDLGALSAYPTAEGGQGKLANRFAEKLPIIVVSLPVLIGFVLVGYYGIRLSTAEYKYKKSLDAVAANDGGAAYSLLQGAIAISPYVDRYHISYAQINLALANSIASNKEITDQDRATIAQLIQQAIREGKNAVALNPQRAANWEVLARIYQTVIPLAENADAFAVQTFGQAVTLDPINPDLRIALGGIYFARGNYDNAIRVFELAAMAKPDHANAHYNLAFAYKEKGEIETAINEMALVLSLVDRTSQDYVTAKQVLEDLQSKQANLQAEGTENLTVPKETEQVLEPPLELPEEAEPPIPQISEEGSPSPSPAGNTPQP